MTLLYQEQRRFYIWNAIVMVAATFMALVIPLSLQLLLIDSLSAEVLKGIASFIFIIDAIFRFIRFKREQNEDGQSYSSFLMSWFLIDVLPAIPFGLVFGSGFIQLLSLIKLIRVSQFIRLFKKAEVKFSIYLTLISFFYWAVLLIHLLCTGWMGVYGINQDSDTTTNYIAALYWTVTTLTSVGYGDILPVSNSQRLYSMLVQISGVGVFGYLIGNVVTILSKLDADLVRYRIHVEHLSTAAKRRGLSKDLQRRVLDYYRYLLDKKTGYDESAFLNTLPESLRNEVAVDLKEDFIEDITLFKNASERFISDIALQLELNMATPGDYIFRQDDPANHMYFVINGELEVLNKEEIRSSEN